MPFSDFENLLFLEGTTEHSYTVPGECRSVSIQALNGQIEMRLETGTTGKKWTLSKGDKETFKGKDFVGQTFFFTAADGVGVILQVRPLMGSGD